jgi:hypothetical protein
MTTMRRCRRIVEPWAFALLFATGMQSPGAWPPRAAAGHWAFDGDLVDRGGRGHDAFLETPAFEKTADGQALRAGPRTARIPDAPELRLAPGFRIECRVRFDTLPKRGWATVAMKGDYSHGEYILRVNPVEEGRHFGFFVNLGGWEPRVESVQGVETGVWYHVAAGWDGSNVWMTVDGKTRSRPRTGTPSPCMDPIEIGPTDGLLDDLRIDNPGARDTLAVAWWPFDGDARDASEHGHDLAATNLAFAAARGGRALLTGGRDLVVSAHPDFQAAAGFRVACDVRFDRIPSNGVTIIRKQDEYQLRVDPAAEGGNLAFFVKLGGWEPRVRSEQRLRPGTWYRIVAGWDGRFLTLDVNGESTRVHRSGAPKPGGAPLTIGPYGGLLANLRIANPRRPVLYVADWLHESILLRAGRPERITAVIRNCGPEARGCSVALALPTKGAAVVEGATAHDLGVLPAGAERTVTWTVRAGGATTATATARIAGEGFAPVSAGHSLAFLPAADPAVGAAPPAPPAPPAGAPTWYIDSSQGNNTNAGTSPEAPWRDFTRMNGRTLGPGERLLLKRGSVFGQELDLSAAGRPDAWAEIGAYGEGPRPVIRRSWHIDDRCVLVRSPQYLRIRSLVVCFAGKGLIVAYEHGGCRGLVVEDCIAHHIEGLYRFNSHGIPEWRDRRGAAGDQGLHLSAGIAVCGQPAEDVAIRDCEMFQCSWGFFAKGNGVAVDRVFCHDNHAFNTSPHPALVGAHRSFLRNSIFDAPGFHAHAGTMGIMLVDCDGLVIRNCHFMNQPDSGSHDEGGIDFEARGQGCLVEACTFRNNAGAAIEVLGLKSPQVKDLEIARSRFFRNNTARKLGPSEVFIWGRTASPDVCCSRGLVRDNGYVLNPGVVFFTNEAPSMTRWEVRGNTAFATDADLDRAMPYNDPPAVSAGPDIWTDRPEVRLAGSVADDGRTPGKARIAWEVLHGPGPVAFADGAAPGTAATFTAPGDYLLRLVADDGELWRSDMTEVHILPPGATTARAWDFSRPLDKEGWAEVNTGTQTQEWENCRSHPVKYVAGGHYIVAVENSPNAHLLSPDALGLDCARCPTVTLRFQNRTPATRMRLRFTTADAPAWDDTRAREFEVVPDDTGTRVYRLDLAATPGWTGRVKQLRLDLATGAPLTGTCRLDYVWIGRAPR